MCHLLPRRRVVRTTGGTGTTNTIQFSVIADNHGRSGPGRFRRVVRVIGHVHGRMNVRIYYSLKLVSSMRTLQLGRTNVAHVRYGVRASPSCFPRVYAARAVRSGRSVVDATRGTKVHIYSKNVVKLNRSLSRHIRVTFGLGRVRVSSMPLGVLGPMGKAPFCSGGHPSTLRVLHAFTVFHFILPGTLVHATNNHRIGLEDLRTRTLSNNLGNVVINNCLAANNESPGRSLIVATSLKQDEASRRLWCGSGPGHEVGGRRQHHASIRALSF